MSGGDKRVVQAPFVAHAPSNSQCGMISHQTADGVQEAYAAQPGFRLPLAIKTELRPNDKPQSSSASLGRRQRYSYGEDERTFVMICAILRNMRWRDIEEEFSARFPAGQKRRYHGIGLSLCYPPRHGLPESCCVCTTASVTGGVYLKSGVLSEEEKARIKTFVASKLLSMHHLPEIQYLAWTYSECR